MSGVSAGVVWRAHITEHIWSIRCTENEEEPSTQTKARDEFHKQELQQLLRNVVQLQLANAPYKTVRDRMGWLCYGSLLRLLFTTA